MLPYPANLCYVTWMEQNNTSFDAIDAVHDLVALGIPQQQAEGQIKIMQSIIGGSAATRQDLQIVEYKLKSEIGRVEQEVKSEITNLQNILLIRMTVINGVILGIAVALNKLF